jgi:hypothetical protein
MRSNHSIDDLILNYAPETPGERFREAGVPAALKSSTGRLRILPGSDERAPLPVHIVTPQGRLSCCKGPRLFGLRLCRACGHNSPASADAGS